MGKPDDDEDGISATRRDVREALERGRAEGIREGMERAADMVVAALGRNTTVDETHLLLDIASYIRAAAKELPR